MPSQTPLILLVEEDPTLLDITTFRLELLGYRVVGKPSAEDAVAWLAENLPDMVIVDQYLPDTEGTELLNRLSNDTRTSELPAILMSSSGDLEEVQKAFNAGADEYLVTPYDPAVLEQKVERLAHPVDSA